MRLITSTLFGWGVLQSFRLYNDSNSLINVACVLTCYYYLVIFLISMFLGWTTYLCNTRQTSSVLYNSEPHTSVLPDKPVLHCTAMNRLPLYYHTNQFCGVQQWTAYLCITWQTRSAPYSSEPLISVLSDKLVLRCIAMNRKPLYYQTNQFCAVQQWTTYICICRQTTSAQYSSEPPASVSPDKPVLRCTAMNRLPLYYMTNPFCTV